jgi:hypothetical protein
MRITLAVMVTMTMTMALGLGTRAAHAGPAEDGERIRVQVNAILAAYDAGDAAALVGLMADTVFVEDHAFVKRCQKPFGKRLNRVTGAKRAKLAACLIGDHRAPGTSSRFEVLQIAPDTWAVVIITAGWVERWHFTDVAATPKLLGTVGPDRDVYGDDGTWPGAVGGRVTVMPLLLRLQLALTPDGGRW